LEDPKYSIERIAAKVAKSPAYCAAKVRLTELAAPVVDAFSAEEIGVGRALLLAKLQSYVYATGIHCSGDLSDRLTSRLYPRTRAIYDGHNTRLTHN
jgi:hypothetical protein